MATKSRVTVFKPIDACDFTVTPFKVHKNYYLDHNNYSASYGANIFVGFTSSSVKIPIGANDAQGYPTTSLGYYKQVIHNSIDNLYYARADKPFESFGTDDIFLSKRNLTERVNVISIPQDQYGENIKPGSVYIKDYSRSGSYGNQSYIELYDDTKENLRDNTIATQSFASSSALVAYWGFNEFYKDKGPGDKYNNNIHFAKDGLLNKHPAYLNRVFFSDGIITTGTKTENTGIEASFNSTGSVRVDHHSDFNFRSDKDFAISFWLNAPPSQSVTSSSDTNIILEKDGQGKLQKFSTTKGLNFKESVKFKGKYPYKIELYNQNTSNSGKLKFSRSDTLQTSWVTGSVQVTGSHHHVICQKTGSNIEIWIDGILNNTSQDNIDGDVHNVSDIWIGSSGLEDKFYSGSLDEIRIYNEALPTDAISSLANNHYISSSAYQTDVAGNVFYSIGHICITSYLPKYKHILTGISGSMSYSNGSGFNLNYKGSHTIYENQAICKINSSDFNLSVNPTLRPDNNLDSYAVKDFVTGSAFNPYITTIGLYNDKGQMLAIGKLAQPIKKPNNVDLNIIVRWDV